MLKKFAYTLFLLLPGSVLANQPKDWQLGFQKSASETMDDIVWFHDYMLLPVITAITVFVLFLIAYACIRFRASKNKEASTTAQIDLWLCVVRCRFEHAHTECNKRDSRCFLTVLDQCQM